MKLDQKILDRIEQENIKIIPRWFFAAKEAFSWLYIGALLATSSLALAMTIVLIHIFGQSALGAVAPYCWLVVSGGLFFWGCRRLARMEFLQIYKISFILLASFVIIPDLLFGFAIYRSGQAQKLETTLEKMPTYRSGFIGKESYSEIGQGVSDEETSELKLKYDRGELEGESGGQEDGIQDSAHQKDVARHGFHDQEQCSENKKAKNPEIKPDAEKSEESDAESAKNDDSEKESDVSEEKSSSEEIKDDVEDNSEAGEVKGVEEKKDISDNEMDNESEEN
jgi:hypothetical protein